MNTIPYSYQVKDVRQLHRFKGRCLLANEMGLGKSLTSLLYVHRRPELRPVIIICPASLKWNWQREASIHFAMRAEVLEGMKPPPNGGFLGKPQFIIINYDILGPWIPYLQSLKPQVIIIDECQALQSRSTKRTRFTRLLCREVPHVIALSGTPLSNRPAEMWPTLNILRPDLFPSFHPYGNRYCGPRRTFWGTEYKGATHLPELHSLLLKEVMIRRRQIDVLSQLPKKRRSVITLPLSNVKEYQHARDNFLDWMGERNPSKLYGAAKAEGVTQLGYLKRLAAQLKMPYVLDWIKYFLEESEGKLVLFAIHKKIISELAEAFGNIHVIVDGSVTGKHRQLAVDKFQNNKNTRLFIGNIDAAGKGLNLTAAHDVAFAEMSWRPADHLQAEKRCHRIGTKSFVQIRYLVAQGTIEEKLAKINQEKQKVLNAVMDGSSNGEHLDIFDQLVKELRKERET